MMPWKRAATYFLLLASDQRRSIAVQYTHRDRKFNTENGSRSSLWTGSLMAIQCRELSGIQVPSFQPSFLLTAPQRKVNVPLPHAGCHTRGNNPWADTVMEKRAAGGSSRPVPPHLRLSNLSRTLQIQPNLTRCWQVNPFRCSGDKRALGRMHASATPHWHRHSVVTGEQKMC